MNRRTPGQVSQRGPFAKGDRILWQQTTPSAGWNKETTAAYNDTCPRIVTGTVGSGGTLDFSTAMTTRSTDNEDAHTHAGPEHSHLWYNIGANGLNDPHRSYNSGGGVVNLTEDVAGGGVTLGDGNSRLNSGYYTSKDGTDNTGAGTAHNHDLDISIKYYDVCIGIKA